MKTSETTTNDETEDQRKERLTIEKLEAQVQKLRNIAEDERAYRQRSQRLVLDLEKQLSRKESEIRKINKKLEIIGSFAKLFKELQG